MIRAMLRVLMTWLADKLTTADRLQRPAATSWATSPEFLHGRRLSPIELG